MAKKKSTPTSAAAMDSSRCNGLPFRMDSCDFHSVSSLVRPYDRTFCTSHASAPLLGNARALFTAPHGGGGYPALLSASPNLEMRPQTPGCIRVTLAIRARPARPPLLVLHRSRVWREAAVDLSEYVLETLRTEGAVVLNRGRHRGP